MHVWSSLVVVRSPGGKKKREIFGGPAEGRCPWGGCVRGVLRGRGLNQTPFGLKGV